MPPCLNQLLELVQLAVDAVPLGLRSVLHLQLHTPESVEQFLGGLGMLTQSFLPLSQRALASRRSLINRLLLVAFVAPEDQTTWTNGFLAVVTIEAQLLVGVFATDHSAAVHVVGTLRPTAVEIDDGVALEDAFGVQGLLAAVAQHPIALDAAPRRDLLFAEAASGLDGLGRAAAAIGWGLRLLDPSLDDKLHSSVHMQVAIRRQSRDLAADRAGDRPTL
mmetsp:Transcript_101158/g.325033  ORF Transcript_101158/g.325033 Transcript_101158/m.325033 type:complete len:220 (-) Transcript_101158:191-850(-)